MEVLGAYLSSPVSIKDRTIGEPLVMLNACLTFSWPNNVPFDREAGRLFGPSGLPATHCTRAVVAGYEGVMIRPKSSRAAPRYFTWIVDSVTNISL
jgi:hypothetical protein